MSPVRTARQGRELDYQQGIRGAVRGLWNGTLGWYEAVDMMVGEVERNFALAWYSGLDECGISPSEQTPEEIARLNFEINTEIQYIYKLCDSALSNSKINGGKLRTLFDRVDMWVNRYTAIRDLARTYACSDQKLKWVMGATKEHCSDCFRLDGRVYRASTWRSADLYPRKHSLACGGFRCACEFVPTDEPCTPGVPPRI